MDAADWDARYAATDLVWGAAPNATVVEQVTALDVGGEHRDAVVGKRLGQDLQGDGLARPGRAGDQPVAIGIFQQQDLRNRVAFSAAAQQHGSPCEINNFGHPVPPDRQKDAQHDERTIQP